MTWTLLKKTFRDGLGLLAACGGMIFAFAWIRVWIVASMETHQFQRIARNLPDLVKRLSPVPIDQFITYPGLIGFTFEEPLAYLTMAVWTIARGSDCVSGEIGRGSMEMLLAQPISRLRYLITHSLVTLLGIAIIASAAYVGTHLGVKTAEVRVHKPSKPWTVPFFGMKLQSQKPSDEYTMIPLGQYIKPKLFVVCTLNYAALGVFLAGATTCLSAFDRSRGRTIGMIVGFYVIQTVMELTGMVVEGYRWLLRFTFFGAYEPVAMATNVARDHDLAWRFWANKSTGAWPDLGPVGYDTVLTVLGLSGFVVAAWVFARRDVPAPL